MNKLIAGIDLGTTALKIAIFDTKGKILGNETLEYKLYTPQKYYVESYPDICMEAIYDKGYEIYKKMQVDCAELFEALS